MSCDLANLRPIALTSHIMKCFERVLLHHLTRQVSVFLDPLQFAYRRGVGVDDALIFMLHNIYSHLETTASSVRILFFDFSSAFNTIQPHILADKLSNFKLHNKTIAWLLDYLLARPQYVRLDKASDIILTNTGAPQGTVLSPFLFSLYTADYRHSQPSCLIQKFSDDTALVGLLNHGNDVAYKKEAHSFAKWCDTNFLQLNVGKTKELIIDFRKEKEEAVPVTINNQRIEIVESYKYLGVHLDNKLNWKENTGVLVKKAQSRLFFLRKLRSFDISPRLLGIFYQGILASVLFYAVLCWGGSISTDDKNRINKIIKRAGSVIGLNPDKLEVIVEKRTRTKLKTVLLYDNHPLHNIFRDLKSSFSERLVMPRCSTERLRRSFVPAAVRYFNHK